MALEQQFIIDIIRNTYYYASYCGYQKSNNRDTNNPFPNVWRQPQILMSFNYEVKYSIELCCFISHFHKRFC